MDKNDEEKIVVFGLAVLMHLAWIIRNGGLAPSATITAAKEFIAEAKKADAYPGDGDAQAG